MRSNQNFLVDAKKALNTQGMHCGQSINTIFTIDRGSQVIPMQTIDQQHIASIAREDYARVKSYLEKSGAPFYDSEQRRRINSTSIVEITEEEAAADLAEEGLQWVQSR